MQILTYILFILVCSVSIFGIGIYFPYTPIIGEYSTIITSFFSAYSVIVSLLLFLFSVVAVSNNYNSFTIVLLSVSLIGFIAWAYPVYSLYKTAQQNNIALSIKENINLQVNRGKPQQDKSVKYLSREGKDLYLDYYPSKKKGIIPSKPLAYVHGGGFTGGNRSEEPEWIEFFTSQGYDVFDIGYTLANQDNPTWNIAAREVQTALSWIAENAETYSINPSELVVAGSSAGGSLAMQAVYGGATSFPAYKDFNVVPVKKIITLFPAVDLGNLWERNTSFYGIRSRDTEYVGGTPAEFPDRYELVNIQNLVSKSTPKTLIIHGASDTLIPAETIIPLKNTLDNSGVKNTFITIPYAQHGFTYFSSSFGFQISAGVIKDFLNN